MNDVFETFKPKSPIVKKFVDYYYIDIKPDNKVNQFKCFPHFNNTISIYKSHQRLANAEIHFVAKSPPLQIFTPIRKEVLQVRQVGPVHRIVIVFHPLGIQQFFRNTQFIQRVTQEEFFTAEEIVQLLSTTQFDVLQDLIDQFLVRRYKRFENTILEQSLAYIFNHESDFSVSHMADSMHVSRQHLNRLFRSMLGISVKKFHEIVLFRKTIGKKLFDDFNQNFTHLAYDFNFNDQSHFNKTYKKLTGNSPKLFFEKGTILGREDTFWHLQS